MMRDSRIALFFTQVILTTSNPKVDLLPDPKIAQSNNALSYINIAGHCFLLAKLMISTKTGLVCLQKKFLLTFYILFLLKGCFHFVIGSCFCKTVNYEAKMIKNTTIFFVLSRFFKNNAGNLPIVIQ